EGEREPAWAVPLDARRVATDQNAAQVAQEQVSQWLQAQAGSSTSVSADQTLIVADSRYSTPPFIYPLVVEEGTNVLVRLRSNRVVYGPPKGESSRRGHPRWYGQRFDLSDPASWPKPDVEEEWTVTDRQGHTRVVHLQAWREMRMRGSREWPMQECPFTLIRVWVTTPEGEKVHPRPLWLALFGPRRNEWPLRAVVEAYFQRSHQEQMHRFLKRNLLATAYQTPEVKNEERWWRILVLACFQLWLARRISGPELRPWERYDRRWREGAKEGVVLSPAQVQRVFGGIIGRMGSPARRLQPRGKPVGREKGKRLRPRPRREMVRKGVSQSQRGASRPN
ncbi:MAG: transposase, partial [Anaerolineae bacterium]